MSQRELSAVMCDIIIGVTYMYVFHLAVGVSPEELKCFLCEADVDVRLEPCNHAILCNDCAQRARKCPKCRVS